MLAPRRNARKLTGAAFSSARGSSELRAQLPSLTDAVAARIEAGLLGAGVVGPFVCYDVGRCAGDRLGRVLALWPPNAMWPWWSCANAAPDAVTAIKIGNTTQGRVLPIVRHAAQAVVLGVRDDQIAVRQADQ